MMTQIITLSDLTEAAQLLPCPIERHQRDYQLIAKYLETLDRKDYPRDPENPSRNLELCQTIITLQSGKSLRFVIYCDTRTQPTWMLAKNHVHIESSEIKKS